jgi:peptide-methionine (R)-S-oxide reductase
MDNNKKQQSFDELKISLKKDNPELYRVAIEKGTEAPFSGKYNDEETPGVYKCAVCGNGLFRSDDKFHSGSGWPSFVRPSDENGIEYADDGSLGMNRTEVLCKKCGAHLGHVFDDGPKEQGGKRYCINSVCLDLEER